LLHLLLCQPNFKGLQVITLHILFLRLRNDNVAPLKAPRKHDLERRFPVLFSDALDDWVFDALRSVTEVRVVPSKRTVSNWRNLVCIHPLHEVFGHTLRIQLNLVAGRLDLAVS